MTKLELKKLIKEEIKNILNEVVPSEWHGMWRRIHAGKAFAGVTFDMTDFNGYKKNYTIYFYYNKVSGSDVVWMEEELRSDSRYGTPETIRRGDRIIKGNKKPIIIDDDIMNFNTTVIDRVDKRGVEEFILEWFDTLFGIDDIEDFMKEFDLFSFYNTRAVRPHFFN